ncbi:MAG TPA: FtsQ-type POTRA domain-containing protein [Anaeromyxobacteraceae bacterium]|nr:FtsQ-type POTRA domain-containing protein [Anaeromyxobacteraceae bacterium]
MDRAAAAPGSARPILRAAGRALAGVALLAAAAALGWKLLAESELLRIREVRFQGTRRASPAELAALSTVRPGEHLLTADLPALERAVAGHPWVKSAEARRLLPPAVEVRVEEREPGALVDLGGLYLVDRQAQVFKRAAPGDGLDLPVVTGFTRDDYLRRRADLEPLLAGALALLEGYSRQGLSAFGALSEVHVDPDEGVTLYIGEEAAQVRLGVGDLPQKLTRLHRALGALKAGGKRAEVLHLDNRNRPSQVTVRLASATAARGKGQPDEAAPAEEASSARRRAEAKPQQLGGVGGMGGRSFTATPHVKGQADDGGRGSAAVPRPGVTGPRGPR